MIQIYNRLHRRAILFMALCFCAAVYLFNAIAYREPLNLLLCAPCALLAFICCRRSIMRVTLTPSEGSEALWDKCHRRAFNWLFFGTFLAAEVVFSSLALSVNNSKPQELLEFYETHVSAFGLIIVGLGVNLILCGKTRHFADVPMRKRFRAYFLLCAAVSVVYWGAVLALFATFNTGSFFTFYVAAALYGLMALGFNLTLRKKALYQAFAFNRVALGVGLGVVVLVAGYILIQRDVWLTQPYINRVPNLSESHDVIAYDDDTGVYTIAHAGGDFKILQLTDIHIGGSYSSYNNDLKALKACYALIEHTRPDLVVVTGDLCFPMGLASFSLNNTAPVMQFAAFMRNIGIPWAFTYGNHDTEAMAATDSETLDALYRSLSWRTSKNLMYPYVQPPVKGRNNQLIEVCNPDGTLNTALFLIDSNAYTGNGFNDYDYIHDDQVDWYAGEVARLSAEAGHTVSSMAFFHIPLQQYKTAYQLYESGSDEVKYFFGSNDEKMFDKVCCSDYPSRFFDVAREMGSTKAMFCGHDHYNNMSLEYQGIRLTYGMSIDYLVMPGIARDTRQRGGTLITLHPDSSFDIEQVPLTSLNVR